MACGHVAIWQQLSEVCTPAKNRYTARNKSKRMIKFNSRKFWSDFEKLTESAIWHIFSCSKYVFPLEYLIAWISLHDLPARIFDILMMSTKPTPTPSGKRHRLWNSMGFHDFPWFTDTLLAIRTDESLTYSYEYDIRTTYHRLLITHLRSTHQKMLDQLVN